MEKIKLVSMEPLNMFENAVKIVFVGLMSTTLICIILTA